MIKFHKYEGAGNDFIMINNLKGEISLKPDYIKHICDRHMGIGADGVILLEHSDKADYFMNYYNSDGTTAQMCGNGARCTAKFYLEQIKQSKARPYSVDIKEISLETHAGIKSVKINDDDTYSVNMGAPVFEHVDFPSGELNMEGLLFQCVSMGNPHAVVQVENLDEINVKTIGPEIENDYHFPNKINVEFVQKISDDNYKVKVWERGCGETLACGTGACAVYSILAKSVRQGLTQKKAKEITLGFPGGQLFLSENREGQIILRGPATFVFEGNI